MLRALLLVLAAALCATPQFRDWPPFPPDVMQLMWKGEREQAMNLLRARAEDGNIKAMFFLGRFYEEVEGVPHDYVEAMRWYIRAAEGKLGAAAWSAGRLHEMGRGTAIDREEARKWYGKANELGFRRTALTKIHARWYPGDEPLTYEPVPEVLKSQRQPPTMPFLDQPPPDISPEDLQFLREAGIRGRIVWHGGEPGLFGLPARIILIAHQRITEELRLPLPLEGTVIYIQRGDTWQRIPEDAKLTTRHVTLVPDPNTPRFTLAQYELDDGSRQGSTIWSWE